MTVCVARVCVLDHTLTVTLGHETELDALTLAEGCGVTRRSGDVLCCDDLERCKELFGVHFVAVRTGELARVDRRESADLKDDVTDRAVGTVNLEGSAGRQVNEFTLEVEGNRSSSTDLDVNLTLTVVVKEVVVEEVIESLLHVLGNLRGNLTDDVRRVCISSSLSLVEGNTIEDDVSTVVEDAVSDFVDNLVREVVAVGLSNRAVTLLTLVTHETVVLTDLAAHDFVTDSVAVLHLPLTLAGNRLQEEELTDRKVHRLNGNDVVCEEFCEGTTNDREDDGFEGTAVVRSSSLSHEVLCLVFEEDSHVLLEIAIETGGEADTIPTLLDFLTDKFLGIVCNVTELTRCQNTVFHIRC